jgi:hypothetical protein
MRTLPAPNKAPAAHADEDDQDGLTPGEMRALRPAAGALGSVQQAGQPDRWMLSCRVGGGWARNHDLTDYAEALPHRPRVRGQRRRSPRAQNSSAHEATRRRGRQGLSPSSGCPGGDQAQQQTDDGPTRHRTGQPELVVQDADAAEERRDREQRTQCGHERTAAVGTRLRRIRWSLRHVSTCRSPRSEFDRSPRPPC